MRKDSTITIVLHYNFYSRFLGWKFIQSGPLNCGSKKCCNFRNVKYLMRLHMLKKPKLSSGVDLLNIKSSKHRVSEKEIKKYPVNFLTTIIALLDI